MNASLTEDFSNDMERVEVIPLVKRAVTAATTLQKSLHGSGGNSRYSFKRCQNKEVLAEQFDLQPGPRTPLALNSALDRLCDRQTTAQAATSYSYGLKSCGMR